MRKRLLKQQRKQRRRPKRQRRRLYLPKPVAAKARAQPKPAARPKSHRGVIDPAKNVKKRRSLREAVRRANLKRRMERIKIKQANQVAPKSQQSRRSDRVKKERAKAKKNQRMAAVTVAARTSRVASRKNSQSSRFWGVSKRKRNPRMTVIRRKSLANTQSQHIHHGQLPAKQLKPVIHIPSTMCVVTVSKCRFPVRETRHSYHAFTAS